jgi:hypothetical protein
MYQHNPHKGNLKIFMQTFLTPTRQINNVAVENGQILEMNEQFFIPPEFTPVNVVTVNHFVTAIHIVHMMVSIHHNLQI